jgi:hypothetical protein
VDPAGLDQETHWPTRYGKSFLLYLRLTIRAFRLSIAVDSDTSTVAMRCGADPA